MIRGYNFPSGTAEKVTIDGNKVTEKMNLYSFQNQVILDTNTPTEPSGYTYQGKLYDGSKLYMKTTLTNIENGSTNSSDGCTGAVLLIKPDGTQLSVAIPTYTIPTERSETGTDPYWYSYQCYLSPSPDGNIYLRLQRQFYGESSGAHTRSTCYQSIYKLNIDSSSLTWATKAIEISLGSEKYAYSNFIIEDNYIYVCSYDYPNSFFTNVYIYGYKYSDTSYEFQKISTNNFDYNILHDQEITKFFVRKGTNTYIYFLTRASGALTNDWISITRNPDGTYSEASGTAPLSKINKSYKMFMLNGEIYVQMLGDEGHEGYEGFHIYKLKSDNSGWEVIYNIANATNKNIVITSYFNNIPDTIFQGRHAILGDAALSPSAIRADGTFDLIKFSPKTLDYSQIPTPKISQNGVIWHYYDYKCNDTGQRFFFFKIVIYDEYHGLTTTQYRCVIEFINGDPVLYSTFAENDIEII